ncbi:MAG: FMN-binding protein [Chloroflexota bacterium]|nr:FMN-binding protein [Chloroflexota bacterium]
MKRAVSALAATVAGVALLVGYKPTPAGSASPSPTPPPRIAVSDDDAPVGAPAPARTPAPTSAPVAVAQSGGTKTVTGKTVDTIFGQVQVRVTIQGKRIVDVQPLQLPFDRARSAYISQVAGPMLRSEAIQAQSANIDVISGATYTSMAYGQSLQSALQNN